LLLVVQRSAVDWSVKGRFASALDSPTHDAVEKRQTSITQKEKNMCEEQYTVALDEDVVGLLKQAIELEAQLKQEECWSDRWEQLNEERNEVLQQIGWSIEYEFKQLPF
jgi:hypothetical protein